VFTKDGYLVVENLVQCGDVAMKRGVKVISISLAFKWKSRLLQEAVDRWNDHGINVVAAAGNDASPHGSRGHPLYPAASDGVIGVTATTEANTRLPSSSVGYWVDVAPPHSSRAGGGRIGGPGAHQPPDSLRAPPLRANHREPRLKHPA
jgi:hypothetical protein